MKKSKNPFGGARVCLMAFFVLAILACCVGCGTVATELPDESLGSEVTDSDQPTEATKNGDKLPGDELLEQSSEDLVGETELFPAPYVEPLEEEKFLKGVAGERIAGFEYVGQYERQMNREIPKDSEPSTVRLICEAYLEGEDTYEDYFTDIGLGWIEIDGREFAPEARLPEGDWTLGDVIQHYREHPEMWVADLNQSISRPHIWSHDYRYEFTIWLDWVYVNDVAAVPFSDWQLEFVDRSVDPMELLEAYQSGEWDGLSFYSTEWSTTVARYYGSGLHYQGEAYRYRDSEDPEGWAWIAQLPTVANFEIQPLDGHLSQSASRSYYYASVPVWLDLPEGKLPEGATHFTEFFGEKTYILRDGELVESFATFILTEDELLCYYRGELVGSWGLQDATVETHAEGPKSITVEYAPRQLFTVTVYPFF